MDAANTEAFNTGHSDMRKQRKTNREVLGKFSPIELCLYYGRRKTTYQANFPETVRGWYGKGVGKNEADADRYTLWESKRSGMSERSIYQYCRRYERIGEVVLRQILNTSLDNGNTLDTIAKMTTKEASKFIRDNMMPLKRQRPNRLDIITRLANNLEAEIDDYGLPSAGQRGKLAASTTDRA